MNVQSNKGQSLTVSLFYLLAIFAAFGIFLYAANRMITNDSFFETVQTVKLKITQDTIAAAPGNIIYLYSENISTYEIKHKSGNWSIGKNSYYSVSDSKVDKDFVKPNQLYFGNLGGSFLVDYSIFDRELQKINPSEINTRLEPEAVRIVVMGDNVRLKEISILLKRLLEDQQILVNRDQKNEFTLILADSGDKESVVTGKISLLKDLDTQKKSSKMAALIMNNIYSISSIDELKIRPANIKDLDNAYTGCYLEFNKNFIEKNNVAIVEPILKAVLRYFEDG